MTNWLPIVCTYILILYHVVEATDVTVAVLCEFRWEACCMSVLAAIQMGVHDANTKNGILIPELANTAKNITLKVGAVFDPDDQTAWESFKDSFNFPDAPVALFGGYYTSRVIKFSQTTASLELPQLAYVSGPVFQATPNYPNVFRMLPVDSLKATAVHKVLEKLGIKNTAVFYTSGDAWSEGLWQQLVADCGSSSYSCTVNPQPVGSGTTDESLQSMLTVLVAAGVRCMVSFCVSTAESQRLTARARLLEIAGSRASGYVWFYPFTVWNTAVPDLWDGSITPNFANSYMKPSKLTSYEYRFKDVVRSMRVRPVSGEELSMASVLDASGCTFLSGPAYETVARVRIALESVDFSLPSNPGSDTFSRHWLGTSLKDVLQSGSDIDGVVAGPNLIKAPALGQQWENNPSPVHIYNFVQSGSSGEIIDLFSVTSTGISDGPDLARGMLPGKIPFGTQSNVPADSGQRPGHLISTPCNGNNEGKCYIGTCQRKATVGRAGGWCACTLGYGGRFCSIRGVTIDEAPVRLPADWGQGWSCVRAQDQLCVPVKMSVYVKKFSGLTDSGDSFTITVVVSLSWLDRRFPYDAGDYVESEADHLLMDYWSPEVSLSKIFINSHTRKLRVERCQPQGCESKDDSIAKDVTLTVTHEYQVTNALAPQFGQFPFDSHALEMDLSSSKPEVDIEYVPITVVPQGTLNTWEQTGWTADFTGNEAHLLTVTTPGLKYNMKLQVTRAWQIMIFRLLLPAGILVIVSWAGFWIAPGALMPRFASGFISFLTMQGFKTYAASLMPNNGKIATASWIDIFISVSSILMGLAVVETVVVQYINENISSRACKYVDYTARWSFPAVFVLMFVLMCIITDIELLNALNHIIVASFTVVFFGYALIHGYAFPAITIAKALQHSAPSRGSRCHEEFKFSDNELRCIFDRICYKSRSLEGKGYANAALFGRWLVKWKPSLKQHSDEFRALLDKHFGTRFHYPCFKKEFSKFLTDLEKLMTGMKIDSGEEAVASLAMPGKSQVEDSSLSKPVEIPPSISLQPAPPTYSGVSQRNIHNRAAAFNGFLSADLRQDI